MGELSSRTGPGADTVIRLHCGRCILRGRRQRTQASRGVFMSDGVEQKLES